ncbi:MAG: PilZ domain-containing protein [Rhodocyclaceae bacterium]|nr:PilZ domain-containing protein [Rhodocyclaceae bacterium]MDZ4214685.1 PilZ domain-containing protein [Rhodocyclaceae bacterium]
MPNTQNRRQFWRAHFHSPVQLAMHGCVSEADLYDISLKGALVKVPQDWAGKNGEHCQLRLALGTHAIIGMSTTITHIDGRRVGLRCENIDLDSVTHLRRLVELNAGDPGLLDRELSALLHETDQGDFG